MRLNSSEKLRCRLYGVDTPPFPFPQFPPYPPPPEAAPFVFWRCCCDALLYSLRWIEQQPRNKEKLFFGVVVAMRSCIRCDGLSNSPGIKKNPAVRRGGCGSCLRYRGKRVKLVIIQCKYLNSLFVRS